MGQLSSKSYKGFNVFYATQYEQLVEDFKESFDELLIFLERSGKKDSFRWKVELGNIQFLTLVKPKERELVLFSKWLFDELNLKEVDIDHPNLTQLMDTPLENSPYDIYYNSIVNGLPLFEDNEELGDLTLKKANEIKAKIEEYKVPLFEKLSNFGLDLTAEYALVRIHLLKYLAVLPSLNHDKGEEVKRLFLESCRRLLSDSRKARRERKTADERALPFIYELAIYFVSIISKCIPSILLALLIRKAVATMAKRFIAGENISLAQKALEDLEKSGRSYTIDQLGELVVSTSEAEDYKEKVLDIIKGIAVSEARLNDAGVNFEHVSIKVSALSNDFRPYAFDSVYEEVSPRLIEILELAKKSNVFINIDAEHFHFRDIVFDIYKKVLLETDSLKDFSYTGIVVQAYLKDSYKHLLDVVNLARERSLVMPIRLVKGAYWDAETVECEAHNLESFQFLNKQETDLNFRQLGDYILKNNQAVTLCVASHNILDHSFFEALKELKYPEARVEHQCLHMTYEGLSTALAKCNYPTRNYIPVGDLLVGMAYLVRRIMENSSQVGVLTIMRSHKGELSYNNIFKEIKSYVYSSSLWQLKKTFKNVYPIRNYEKKKQSITEIQIEKSNLHEVNLDSVEELNKKIKLLEDATKWADLKFRIASLHKLANLLLINREELTGLIIKEANKTLEEAIADVDEAIDFITFYTSNALNLLTENKAQAKGIIAVIAPWNFPLAIPVGMSIAPLAMGNRVILKPSEQTPYIIKRFNELTIEAGIPESAFQVINGAQEVGKALTSHEKIDGVVFTGSMSVGSMIYKSLKSKINDKNPVAITEMGGKNAVIVTNNCELDETVSNLLYSSFAHAGQKCSASSRIIIDNKVKDAFLARFIDAAKDIKVGDSLDFSTYVNPLIGSAEKEKTLKNVALCREEIAEFGGKVHLDRSDELGGNLVGPTIFEISKEQALTPFTQAKNEFFAPLIHIIGYDHIDEAVKIFNSTHYALTGGIFSQSDDDCEYLIDRLEAGNLYINRSNTGARVAIEPFGGFKLSGTGPKAGSKEYLYSFIDLESEDVSDEILMNELKSFMRNSHYEKDRFFNRVIPGQINFNKNNTPLGRGIVLIDRKLSLFEKIEIVLANYAKNEITLYFSPEFLDAQREYDELKQLCPGKINKINALDPVHYGHFNFMLGDNHLLKEHAEQFVQDNTCELKKVLNFSHKTQNFHRIILKYTHAKSFAINVMRYGALMDLQEELNQEF